MKNSTGLVGVIAQDTGRFTQFASSLTGLILPGKSRITWQIGHSVASNCNALCQQTLEGAYDWLWLLGDDHAFVPDLLTRLLETDADVAFPLCYTRIPPYRPVVFSENREGLRRPLSLDSLGEQRDVGIHSGGSAGVLIRRHVLEGLEEPWFQAGTQEAGGRMEMGEDLYFCDRAREAGFSLKVNLNCLLGHMTTAVVWPLRQPDGWTCGLSLSGGLQVSLPKP